MAVASSFYFRLIIVLKTIPICLWSQCVQYSSTCLWNHLWIYYPPQKIIFWGGIMIWPSVRPSKICPSGWISPNTNEHFFLILYTCIYYNPPMNPVKFRQDQIQNGWLIAILVCWNWQYLKILSARMNISNTNEHLFPIVYTCIYYNPLMNPYNLQPKFLPGGGYHCVSDILVVYINIGSTLGNVSTAKMKHLILGRLRW